MGRETASDYTKQAVIRSLVMLGMIPKAPGKITINTIHSRLADAGFKISVRTLQRDLLALQRFLPLAFDEDEGRRYRWFWMDAAHTANLPLLDARFLAVVWMAWHVFKTILPLKLQRYLNGHVSGAAFVASLKQAEGKHLLGKFHLPANPQDKLREAKFQDLHTVRFANFQQSAGMLKRVVEVERIVVPNIADHCLVRVRDIETNEVFDVELETLSVESATRDDASALSKP